MEYLRRKCVRDSNVKSGAGFTLVETVVSVGICMLIGIAIVDFFISNDSLIRSQEAGIDVIGSASSIANDLHIMTSQAIEIVDTGTVLGTAYTSGTTTLILRLPSITTTGELVEGQSDYIVYYATGTSAYRLIEGGAGSARASSTRLLGNYVDSLTFAYSTSTPTPGQSASVEIDIETSRQFKKTTAQTELREKIYLRNK
jgi:hypothetical protein